MDNEEVLDGWQVEDSGSNDAPPFDIEALDMDERCERVLELRDREARSLPRAASSRRGSTATPRGRHASRRHRLHRSGVVSRARGALRVTSPVKARDPLERGEAAAACRRARATTSACRTCTAESTRRAARPSRTSGQRRCPRCRGCSMLWCFGAFY